MKPEPTSQSHLTRRQALKAGSALLVATSLSEPKAARTAEASQQRLKLGIAGEALCWHAMRAGDAVKADPMACGNVEIHGVWASGQKSPPT